MVPTSCASGFLRSIGKTKFPSARTCSSKWPSPTAACATRCAFCSATSMASIRKARLRAQTTHCSTAGSSSACTASLANASKPTKPTSFAKSSTRSTTSARTTSRRFTSMPPRTACTATRSIRHDALLRNRRCTQSSLRSANCSHRSSPTPPTRHGNTHPLPKAACTSRISRRPIPPSRPAKQAPRQSACLKSNTPSKPRSKRACRPRNSRATTKPM